MSTGVTKSFEPHVHVPPRGSTLPANSGSVAYPDALRAGLLCFWLPNPSFSAERALRKALKAGRATLSRHLFREMAACCQYNRPRQLLQPTLFSCTKRNLRRVPQGHRSHLRPRESMTTSTLVLKVVLSTSAVIAAVPSPREPIESRTAATPKLGTFSTILLVMGSPKLVTLGSQTECSH